MTQDNPGTYEHGRHCTQKTRTLDRLSLCPLLYPTQNRGPECKLRMRSTEVVCAPLHVGKGRHSVLAVQPQNVPRVRERASPCRALLRVPMLRFLPWDKAQNRHPWMELSGRGCVLRSAAAALRKEASKARKALFCDVRGCRVPMRGEETREKKQQERKKKGSRYACGRVQQREQIAQCLRAP